METVAVTNVATRVVPKVHQRLTLDNTSETEVVFLGNSDQVATSGPNRGVRLHPGERFVMDQPASSFGEIWAVCDTNAEIALLRVG